jgi:hypothetical protein
MTLEEFCAVLKQSHGWRLENGHIRKKTFWDGDFCPITWVAKKIKGFKYLVTEWPEAAYILHIETSLADNIVFAADNWKMPNDEYRLKVRGLLLEATGLSE